MTSIQKDILNNLLTALEKEKGFDKELIAQWKNLLESDKKVKPQNVVELLSGQSNDDKD